MEMGAYEGLMRNRENPGVEEAVLHSQNLLAFEWEDAEMAKTAMGVGCIAPRVGWVAFICLEECIWMAAGMKVRYRKGLWVQGKCSHHPE